MSYLMYLLLTGVFVLIGAFLVREAVIDFKKGEYFCFGIDLMLTVNSTVGMLYTFVSWIIR